MFEKHEGMRASKEKEREEGRKVFCIGLHMASSVEYIDCVTLHFWGRNSILGRTRDVMHHRHNRGCFGFLYENPTPPRCGECELPEGVCKTEYLTWLWKQWVSTPPAVVMMQWKPIQLFLKLNCPDSESLTLSVCMVTCASETKTYYTETSLGCMYNALATSGMLSMTICRSY